MKRRILCLLLALGILLAGCGTKDTPDTAPQPESTAETEETPAIEEVTQEGLSIPEQLECIRDHSSVWLDTSREMEREYRYAVTDLNQDGNLEILRAHQLGYGYPFPLAAWYVTDDGALSPMAIGPSGVHLSDINPVSSLLLGYREDGICRYLVGTMNGGPEGTNMFTYFLSFQNGEIVFEPFRGLGIARNEFDGTTNYYYDSGYNELSEETYNNLLNQRIPDESFISFCPGWYDVDAYTDIDAFVNWSWAYSQAPEENALDYGISELPDLRVFADAPDGLYHQLGNQIRTLSNGFSEYSDDRIRFIAGRPDLTVSLEVIRYVQTAYNDYAYHADFTAFSFQPSVASVYELPVILSEGAPMCRLAVSDGINTEYCYLTSSLVQDELWCTEPQPILPRERDAIMGVCKAVAGFAIDAGNPEGILKCGWDVVSNAISLNQLSFRNTDEAGNLTLPNWLLQEYTITALGFIPDWYAGLPQKTGTTAVRPRSDTSDAYTVTPVLLQDDGNTRITRVFFPEEDDYDPALGTVAVDVSVWRDYEESAIVFLVPAPGSILGWEISNVIIANG